MRARGGERQFGATAHAVGAAIALTSVLSLSGCTSPVAAGLDENDANRILLVLDRANVDATKEADPQAEGKFRVLVPKDDTARSLETMRDEELPRPRPAGVLQAMNNGALVPSLAAEHAQLVAGLAGDLERTLEAVDGVLSARVHLNVPTPDPLREGPVAKTTASVLLEHRGTTPPLAGEAMQRLVAGGVSGLAPTDVAIVTVGRPAPAGAGGPRTPLAHVGPIAVAAASVRTLQASLAVLVSLVALLASLALVLFQKLARSRGELQEALAAPLGLPGVPRAPDRDER